MRNTKSFLLWAVLSFLLPLHFAGAANAPAELLQKLQSLTGISDVQSLECETYPEKYVFFIDQPLDPHHPEAGSFKQRVVLFHVGFDRPTVLVTEGYAAAYALNPRYQEEVSKLFNANMIFAEYRYFGKSVPEPLNWDYLTVENSLYDLHHITTTFKQLYAGKWISTGISKGGQTTMFYRAFFPDDIDISIPYVAPLNQALEDGRHEPFIDRVSTPEKRQRVLDFQLEVLKRKARLFPEFEKYCAQKGYTFRIPVSEVYDLNTFEYSFAIWQWGTPVSQIPANDADDQTILKHYLSICEPDYFSEQTSNLPFFVQAAKELGYYGYDIRPFEKYLDGNPAKDYLHRAMIPAELKGKPFDFTLYNKVVNFLKTSDPDMIYIYGGDDPWTASGVTWLEGKKNIKVYTLPGGSHRTRIGSFDEKTQSAIKAQINAWLAQ